MTVERRFIATAVAPVKLDNREYEDVPQIIGYAATFFRADDPGTEYELFPGLVERIMPTAFDRALQEKDDTRALFNHNTDFLLGRVSAGTLKLTKDSRGLAYEIDPPDTQIGRDVTTSIKRGDLTGSSFAFVVERATWIEDGERDIRQIDSVKLYDVGPVTFPAYEAATTGLRSVDGLHKEWQEWRAEKERRKAEEQKRRLSDTDRLLIRAELLVRAASIM